jgi:hypothetical protein
MRSSSYQDEYPDLTPERLEFIAKILIKVRDEIIDSCYEPENDDGPWSLNCHCYDRTKNRIARIAEEVDWLEVTEPGMEFLFRVVETPVRFHKETLKAPRTKLKNQPVTAAIQTTIGNLGVPIGGESYLRLAVVASDDHRAYQVDLVKYDHEEVLQDRWCVITRDEVVSSNVTPLLEAGRVLPAPPIRIQALEEASKDDN